MDVRQQLEAECRSLWGLLGDSTISLSEQTAMGFLIESIESLIGYCLVSDSKELRDSHSVAGVEAPAETWNLGHGLHRVECVRNSLDLLMMEKAGQSIKAGPVYRQLNVVVMTMLYRSGFLLVGRD